MLNISKLSSRSRIKKQKKPLQQKSKFHAQDNPLKNYKRTKRTEGEILLCAAQIRSSRLAAPTDGESAFAGILDRIGLTYEQEKIIYYGDRFALFDFYLPAHSCAFEIDGGSHNRRRKHDAGRDKYFAQHGITTHRFTNQEVLRHPQETEARIREILVLPSKAL